MKIRPARGYVLIQPLEADEVSAGGVYMPERAKDLPNRGKVLAVGEPIFNPLYVTYTTDYTGPRYTGDPPCKAGDIVYYKKFVDNKIKKEGKEYLLVPFQDILAIDEE